MRTAPAYRSDIDGLRAIAVIAVVLYHADVPGFGGGYVGVDVFFVISGYLITRLLTAQGQRASVGSLLKFYERRARRILPALFVVLLVTAAAGLVILFPADLVWLGKHIAANVVFLGNLASWTDGSYFNAEVPRVALRHLWSIAVEEQFYVVYPPILWFAARHAPGNRVRVLTALAVLSFAFCVWASYRHPSANYYFAGSRAWELLLGAIVALAAGTAAAADRSSAVSKTAAAAGLVLLAVSIGTYSSTMRYPGINAIMPCVATAGLLWAGEGGGVSGLRFLSSRPLVFIGLISYSLYLWHWPILTFVKYCNIRQPGPVLTCLMLLGTFVVAAASWKFVEQPFRQKRLLRPRRPFGLAAAGAGVLIGVAGTGLWYSNGLPQRLTPEVRAIVGHVTDLQRDTRKCMDVPIRYIETDRLCHLGAQDPAASRVVVWGDSHALALLPAYEKLARRYGLSLYFAAKSGCPPLLDVADGTRHPASQAACIEFNSAMAAAVKRLDPRAVFLVGYWTYSYASLRPGERVVLPAGESAFLAGMRRAAVEISAPQRTVWAVLGAPALKYPVSHAMAMARRRGIAEDFIPVTRSQALAQSRQIARDLQALETNGLIRVVDMKDALCRISTCAYQAQGKPLYCDKNHLSLPGAEFVAPVLEPLLRDLRGRAT